MSDPTFRRALAAVAAANDVAFAEYVAELRYPTHLRELVGFVRDKPRCGVLEPRGHAKTTGATYALARRIGETHGRARIMVLTEADDDAAQRSLAIRRIVESERFAQVFPWAKVGVRGAKWTEKAWTIRGAEAALGKDATLTAGSLWSAKPGPRVDLLLLDDIIGPASSRTAEMRAKALERFSSVITPMLVPTGQIIVLGTRWNEDDLYATFVRDLGWPFLIRKAIGDDGTVLWPEVWPLERLQMMRHDIGSPIFDLQYQNDPSGMGGNVFMRKWFSAVDALPAGCIRRGGLDLASSASERADYTSWVEWAEDPQHRLYLLGAWAARLDESHRAWLTGYTPDGSQVTGELASGPRLLWPLRDLPPIFAAMGGRPDLPRTVSSVNVESVAFQSTFHKELTHSTRLPVRAVHPDSDKVTRARALAARYEAGEVFHLRGAPGLDAYESQAVAFPNAAHDDIVDAAVFGADLHGSDFYFASGRRS